MRLSQAVVGPAEAEAAADAILAGTTLGMGAQVDEFECELAEFLAVPRSHVTCVSSGTAALHLSLEATLPPGAEVLVQSLTFVASFQAIHAAGAVPVPCEVRPESFTVDLADAARRVTSRTRAIMPVHYASYAGDLDSVYAFADHHNLRVVEDAAHAFGCQHHGRPIGAGGDVCCFSFDGIKNITSIEGGAVVTADAAVTRRIKDARLLGVERDTENRFGGRRSWRFDVTNPGYRYHMSNVCAALGRVQLGRFRAEFAPKRVALAQRYRDRLHTVPGLRLLVTDLGPVIPHIQPVVLTEGLRDTVGAALSAAGVEWGIHYKPNHLLRLFGGGRESLPRTEQLAGTVLSLPLHPALSMADVDDVCSIVETACGVGDT